MNWKKFFLKIYNLIDSKQIETPEMDNFIRSLSDNDNHIKIAFFIWRAYYNNQDKNIKFWGGLFREIIDFIEELELAPRDVLINRAEPITEKYNDNDITKVFYYVIKEIEQK